jgi:hypothetical protein
MDMRIDSYYTSLPNKVIDTAIRLIILNTRIVLFINMFIVSALTRYIEILEEELRHTKVTRERIGIE